MKRIFDFCLALFGLALTWPIMLLVAIIIKLTSPGPVLFRQKRLTKGMKEFTIFKFRSMRTDFDKDAKGIQVKGSSTAITPIGKFIRKSKLDEFPQLFNILRGDMSFVGPRPELPRRLKYYNDQQKEIFQVRSGISSPASIVFSDEEYLMEQVKDAEKYYIEQIMPYKIELNRYYLGKVGLIYDTWMILATVLKIVNLVKPKQVVSDQNLLASHDKLVEATVRY